MGISKCDRKERRMGNTGVFLGCLVVTPVISTVSNGGGVASIPNTIWLSGVSRMTVQCGLVFPRVGNKNARLIDHRGMLDSTSLLVGCVSSTDDL